MAKNNAINLDVTNNVDGFDLAGGTTERKLTLTGADITLTGSGSNTYTYPSATDTLVGRDSTDTLTNKIINTASNTITVVASDVSDFESSVTANSSVAANTSASHAESHTIVSHSDTTATGTELNTLTSGGDTTLHDHAGISENTTHRSSSGSDHSDVVTNTAKVSYTKTNVKGTINHGGTAGTARPSGFASVEWIGTIEPSNATNDDTWIDVS